MSEPDLTCPACGAEVLEIDVRCDECGASLASTGAMRMIGGVVLDQYEITDVLGQGGMSIVYKGHHRLTNQEVALKVLPPELAAHHQVKSRFLEEAKALAALDHPNIVHLYNFGEDAGCFVLAMQFVRGQTLERMIWAVDRLDWRQVCKIGIDTLKALEYAHSKGVVHRDMKPSNVLVRESDGAATVMDFGIAKMEKSTRLTATGQTMGTVRYMSPEQVRGQAVDKTTDIYSFAVSMYEALVGDTPFDGETHFEIMTKHLGEAPTPPSKLGLELPVELEAILMQGMAKNPDDRPQTAAEIGAVLEKLIEGEVVPEFQPPSAPLVRPSQIAETAAAGSAFSGIGDKLEGSGQLKAKPKPWLWIAVGLVVAASGAAVAAMLATGGGQGPVSDAGQTQAAAAADAAPRWPEAHLWKELKVTEDRRYQDAELRIVTSGPGIDPDKVKTEIGAARQKFIDFLRGSGIDSEIAMDPLNVVLVPAHVLCDPRVYEDRKAPDDCADQPSYYRPTDKTLFLVEDEARRVRSLPADVAMVLCLHRSEEIPNCGRLVPTFLRSDDTVD
ncbi:MAG: serine/threonine protein kinase [Deltaproteobacteria bacterium]|nr:serine/threonine protein kinase [Deltaproteobacteria bacterium]